MAPTRIYFDGAQKTRAVVRRKKERAAKAERAAIMAALTPKTAAEIIGFYRTERAKAEERWRQQGGPSCGLTSGRHPICRGSYA